MTDTFSDRLQGVAQNSPRVAQPSRNVIDRSSVFAPMLPLSNRAHDILADQFGPLLQNPQHRAQANQIASERFEDELGGFNVGRIHPGLSADPRDELLRQDVAEMLSGQPSLAERLASLFENLPTNARAGNPAQSPFSQSQRMPLPPGSSE